MLLEKQGDLAGAEAAYRRADVRGDAAGAFSLGLLYEQTGDLVGAAGAYRRADDRGHPAAATHLGLLLEQHGDLEGAEAAYRRADQREDAVGAFCVAQLLERRGDLAGAEAAFARADRRGHASAASDYGVLLAERGDLAGAEAAFRRADERGDSDGAFNLGVVLERKPDLATEQAAYRRAHSRDDEARGGARAPLNVGRRRIIGDIGIQVVARAANLLLGVVVTLIIVRGLGVGGFGVWSTMLAIAQMVTTFGDLGLSQVTVSRAAADPAAEADWLGTLLALRLLLSVPICIIELIVMFALAPNGHVRVAGALIASTAIVGAAGSLTAAFQLRVRNDLSMLVMTVNSVLWTGGTALVAGFTSDIRVYAFVFLISSVVSTALTVVLVLNTSRVHLAGVRRLWKEMLRVGVVLGAAGVLVILYVRLDQVLVFKFAGSRQAGLYAAAYRILDQAQFIPGSVMATLFPLIASAYPVDLPRVRRFLQISAEYLSIGSFGALAFTIVVAEPVMVLLFGARFAPAAPALPVLMGAFISISFGYLAGSMVVILGLQRRYLLYAAIGLIVNVALNVVLIPKYGFKAAAWVTLLTEVTVMSLTMGIVLKRLHMTPAWPRLGRIALAAALMGLAVALARHAGVPLSGLVVIAVTLYLSLLFASRAVTVHEITSLLRRKAIE